MSGALSMNIVVNVSLTSIQYLICSFLCFILSSLGPKEALKAQQWCFTAVHTVHSQLTKFTIDHGPSPLKQQFWTAGESIIHPISLPTSFWLVPRLNPRLSSPKRGSLTGASSSLLLVNIDKHIQGRYVITQRHCSLLLCVFISLFYCICFISFLVLFKLICPPALPSYCLFHSLYSSILCSSHFIYIKAVDLGLLFTMLPKHFSHILS